MHCIRITEQNFTQVQAIYAEGLATEVATFETQIPDWSSWHLGHHSFARIAALKNQQLLGWAALSPVSQRKVYWGVAEISIYIAAVARGQGVGKFLLNELIGQSEANGIWTLQSSVFRENIASIALHKGCGFRIIGHREKIAQRNGRWYDNVLLERRSANIGQAAI